MDPSVAVPPFEFTSIVLLIASREERFASGKRTRSVYGRSLITTGVAAGSPSTMADAAVVSWSVVNPAFAAVWGFTANTTSGPLVILPRASATFGAHVERRVASGEKSFTTTGWGAPVKSPIMS